jgi:hypothetical protein
MKVTTTARPRMPQIVTRRRVHHASRFDRVAEHGALQRRIFAGRAPASLDEIGRAWSDPARTTVVRSWFCDRLRESFGIVEHAEHLARLDRAILDDAARARRDVDDRLARAGVTHFEHGDAPRVSPCPKEVIAGVKPLRLFDLALDLLRKIEREKEL